MFVCDWKKIVWGYYVNKIIVNKIIVEMRRIIIIHASHSFFLMSYEYMALHVPIKRTSLHFTQERFSRSRVFLFEMDKNKEEGIWLFNI